MTLTRLRLSHLLRFSRYASLSMKLMAVGVIITVHPHRYFCPCFSNMGMAARSHRIPD